MPENNWHIHTTALATIEAVNSFFVHAIYNSLCCLQYFAIGYESKTIDLVNGNWYIYLLLAISSLGIGYFVVKTMNLKLSSIKK